ncbi:MAG: hypothetical protein ACE1Y4_03350 [Lysobacterales bacterium]
MHELKPTTAEERADLQALYDHKGKKIMCDELLQLLMPAVRALRKVEMDMIKRRGAIEAWLCGAWVLLPQEELPRLLADVDRLEKWVCELKQEFKDSEKIEAGRQAAKVLQLVLKRGSYVQRSDQYMNELMAAASAAFDRCRDTGLLEGGG